MTERIPATIVTGFLGAGKTTLIRNLIARSNGRRIALIVNEFGDMGFDGELLSDCGDDECRPDTVVELTNGCICCTVADDFLPTMEMLLARERIGDKNGLNALYADYVRLLDRELGIRPPDDLVGYYESLIG